MVIANPSLAEPVSYTGEVINNLPFQMGLLTYVRASDWRNYEYTRKPLEFSNTEAGSMTFRAWEEMEDIVENAN